MILAIILAFVIGCMCGFMGCCKYMIWRKNNEQKRT